MKIKQRRERLHARSRHVLLQIPRQLLGIVPRELLIAHSEHGIQLLEREVLRLGEQEVAVHPAEEVPRSIPPERALWGESLYERGPGQGEQEVEAPAGGGGEGHADVAEVEGEGFGGVGEGHGALAGRVHGHEGVDGGGDGGEPLLRGTQFAVDDFFGQEERHTAPEEAETHEREGGEK